MAISIIDGLGSDYLARVNSEGRLLVDISGAVINIGSVSAHVDSIYVQSGVTFVDTRPATQNSYNPRTVLVYSGTAIGSIYKISSTGSIVRALSYDGSNNLTVAGAWVQL